jgi:Ca-activated chloride channel family protein
VTGAFRLGIASVVVAMSGSLLAAQAPAFSARTRAVRIDVLVTSGGRPVTGLGADDFEVRDNGVVQRVDLVSFEEVPLNLVLALDVSDSVSGERLTHLRQAATAVLQDLRDRDQAVLITFSHAIVVHGALTRDRSLLEAALSRVEPEGGSAILDAVQSAIVLGESEAGRALVLVFSDGVDTASWLTQPELLKTARRSDAVIYGLTARASTPLREVTDATGGIIFDIASTANLRAAFRAVLDDFRSRYLVSYTPTGVPTSGWHTLDVKVKSRRGMRVKARPGYLGEDY